ncbi:STAS domain-containing protein [Deinococcus peraridilitoris]|uniref:Anti-anti-sigma regulatory factor (Antagonist of anti-sigma factor) n=1 Tax=Deinococcus peraridilitoris (strain DSM 19664 / LMG 22246 / CIP 109416 / KR-200) TaxID=937777 RepID=K9ZX51_DEIPD|nr:STAS domain-containing protein [Deinococcus peraridilitoris]AFZ66131.1 anti-anti-sigma regulatory factor (antagonist of anti-sigma factor) [Deinococcus peraridilitoris DSM 19664]
MTTTSSAIAQALQHDPTTFLQTWLAHQLAAANMRRDLIGEAELRRESQEFISVFSQAVAGGNLANIDSAAWQDVKSFLERLSNKRVMQGFSSSEVAMFVMSFKQPLFEGLRTVLTGQPEQLANELWTSTVLIDQLGLFTVEVFQRGREEIIERQRQEVLELSTPVIKVWEGVVAVPLIGTLDSERTQVVMESLLQRIVETGSTLAIIDITGVPTVDTLVAQHLLRTVAAAKLMGAECIISGIRPQIAQTIVHLGIDLSGVITKSSLADAIQVALARKGYSVTRSARS